MYAMLLTPLAAILIFLLPGFSLARVLRITFENPVESIFYSISLSFALIVFIGFVLGNTIGLTPETIVVSFLLAGFAGIVSIGRKLPNYLWGRGIPWRRTLEYVEKTGWKFPVLAAAAAIVTSFNWSYSIGTHAIDMGEHVYWAKVIMATSRMPNYYSVEPLDQAVKFTYGAHLTLAQFFLVAGIPIEEYSWIPTLIGSMAIWTGVVLFAYRLGGSRWTAAVAGLLYGSAYQPYGYIVRGNLPDIAGYLLLVSTLYSVLRVRKNPSFFYAFGLTMVSVIPSHQLATVILPTVLLFAIPISAIRSRPELVETLWAVFGGRRKQSFWTLILLLAIVYAGTVTYVSSSAASQLVTGNWRPYVLALYNDPLVPGVALGLLGTAGLIFILPRRSLGYMLLLAWTIALIFLANALLIGIPIPDPSRFLWRLTEPFSIAAAVFAWAVLKTQGAESSASPLDTGVWTRRKWIRSAAAMCILAIISIQVAGLVVPTLEGASDVFSLPSRYKPPEPYYEDDKRIGLWLGANSSYTSVIVNDADVDTTATWIEPYSMRLHFLFRADFAAIVAPANYIQIYKSAGILYQNPSDCRVPSIIQQYDITYVIAHANEIKLFSTSPFFMSAPIFQTGASALFVPKPSSC